jgi:stress-induced morphogen
MAMCATELEETLRKAFPDAQIHLIDTMGDQDHYEVTLTSDVFLGKSRVVQHQMVYTALGDALKARLHAISVKTQPLTKDA